MSDDIDDDGTIWIWRLMSGRSAREANSGHLTRETRWALAEHRLAQMQREAARNIMLLKRMAGPKSN